MCVLAQATVEFFSHDQDQRAEVLCVKASSWLGLSEELCLRALSGAFSMKPEPLNTHPKGDWRNS